MIDSKIIEMHQWVVDTTEKKVTYLAEFVMFPSIALNIVTRVLNWKGTFVDAFFMFLTLLVGGALVYATKNEVMFKSLGNTQGLRYLLLGCVGLDVFFLMTVPSGAHFLNFISSILFASYYYFAACEGPRPKKRKEKLVLRTM